MKIAGELLDLVDHINVTVNLARSAQMACSDIHDPERRAALDCLLDLVWERLQASKETTEVLVDTAQAFEKGLKEVRDAS
ncbi:MAG TPA: hypothetical protein VGN60_01965 [Devosia sp.]|jgi:hypothetical protein|nr:hypothetical protein [Devosia sp.]